MNKENYRMQYKKQYLGYWSFSRAWVGFPVVLLSFAVASLTLVFYQKLSDIRQWNALQAPIVDEAKLWEGFSQKIVYNFDKKKALPSLCYGFCPIQKSTSWPHLEKMSEDFQVRWRLDSFSFTDSQKVSHESFRICARLGSQEVTDMYEDSVLTRCWWLREVNQKINVTGYSVLDKISV